MNAITPPISYDFDFFLLPTDDFALENQAPTLYEEPTLHEALPVTHLAEEEDLSSELVLDKVERRRLNNKESARQSRARTKDKMVRLEQFELSISQMVEQISELLKKNINPELAKDLKSLKILCKTDSTEALRLLQTLFIRVVNENAHLQPITFTKIEETPSESSFSKSPPPPVKKVKKIAAKVLTSKDECARIKTYVQANEYQSALELVKKFIGKLIQGQLLGRAKGNVMGLFAELVTHKSDEPFYGWIRFALAWNRAKKGEHTAIVLDEYEQAAMLGCDIARQYKASFLQDNGRVAEAIIELEKCIAENLNAKDAAQQLVELLEANPVQTEKQRNRIIDLYKFVESATAFYNLGFIFLKGWASTSQDQVMGFDPALVNLDHAEFYFRKSNELAPNEPDTLSAIAETILLGKQHLTEERRLEAMNFYGLAIEKGSKEAFYLRALAYLDENRRDLAIDDLKKIDVMEPLSESDAAIKREALFKLRMLQQEVVDLV